MKVVFEDYTKEDITNEMSFILRDDNSLFLHLLKRDFSNLTKEQVFFEINKNQLKNIIGCLLHIQSKMNK